MKRQSNGMTRETRARDKSEAVRRDRCLSMEGNNGGITACGVVIEENMLIGDALTRRWLVKSSSIKQCYYYFINATDQFIFYAIKRRKLTLIEAMSAPS